MKTYKGSSDKSFDQALQDALNNASKSVDQRDITFAVEKISGTYSRDGGVYKMIDVEISIHENTQNVD